MTNHPLTDEICDELWDKHACYFNLYEEVRLTCRDAYDIGYTKGIEEISLRWADAVQSDLENGVKCLNERAAQELATKYPSIFAFGEVLKRLERMRPEQLEDN